ncbi:MAG: FecR domain-containing protein [Pseudomonadota bacterium]
MRRGLATLGLLLTVVFAQAAPPEPLPEWRYTLRPGDTLIGLSQRYLAHPAGWARLQRHNRIADPRRLVPGTTLRIPLAWLRQTPSPATVVAVSGTVRVTPPGEEARAPVAGESLYAGTALGTAQNSSVTLRFADGSTLVLQPGARMILDTVSVYAGGGMTDTRLRLQQGRVEVGANPSRTSGSRLQVITPSAVAAVRGTRFRVEAGAALAREETLEGAVVFGAAGRDVDVAAGLGSVAESGKPPSPPVALLPAPDVSGLSVRYDSLPLRFDLPALAGATQWIGQIAPDDRFEQVLLEKSDDAPRLSFADLPDGDYTLRVRVADVLGLQGRDALHAFTLDARPFAPLPAAPDARVRTARPTLQWSAVSGSEAYRIELARDAGFAGKIVAARTDRTQWRVDAPLAPGPYHWRVASIAGTDTGPFSPAQRFIYDPLPDAPDVNGAAPAFAGDALALQLPAPPAGLRYELVVSSDEAAAHVLWRGESRDGTVRAAPLKPQTVYLAARLVEADGAAGPFATRRIDAPPRQHWELLLLLLPLLAL